MCEFEKIGKDYNVKIKEWAVVAVVGVIVSWMGWVSLTLIAHATEMWTKDQHEEYEAAIQEDLSEIRTEQARGQLSEENKQWLSARFDVVNAQFTALAETQRDIKLDVRDLKNQMNKEQNP